MKVLYFTDLHGSRWKRERIVELAIAQKVNVVIDGGDILPGDSTTFDQEYFLRSQFTEFCRAMANNNVYYLTMLANDDPRIFDAQFNQILSENRRWLFNLAQARVFIDGYEFIGMNWVVDHPFRMKDRCRLDCAGAPIGGQLGVPYVFEGMAKKRLIYDWSSYIGGLPTIMDELNGLPEPEDVNKTIYVIHMPPFGLKLGTVGRKKKVRIKQRTRIKKMLVDLGSQSVRTFIEKKQPWLTLHGHIHQSPTLTGVWKVQLGNTLCIQPGQKGSWSPDGDKLTYVLIDLETRAAERFEESPSN